MEIYVEGKAEKSFKPDEVRMTFTFTKMEKTYQKTLESGCNNVARFIEFMGKLGFDKNDCKTSSFSVRENNVYDEKTRSYKKDGFVFTQRMLLVYDYDVKKFADALEKISNEKDAPKCMVNFGLKDTRKAERALYEACVKDAKEQAETIAKASGLKLAKCEKVSCMPFENAFTSATSFDGFARMEKSECCFGSASDSIQNTFVPEDIIVSNTLYAIWQAE